jgi:hypothetical protein
MSLDVPLATGNYTISMRGSYTLTAGSIRVSLLNASSAVVSATEWRALADTFAQYDFSITTTGIATQVMIEAIEGVPPTLLSLGADPLIVGGSAVSLT